MPPEIGAGNERHVFWAMLLTGSFMVVEIVGGLAVNIAAFALLHGGDRKNLNIRGAVLHVAGDLLGSVAAILAAAVILTIVWTAADPLLSMIVAVLLLRSASIIARDAGHILMEGTPPGLKIDDVRADLMAHVDGIKDVHHIHAWSLTPAKNVMTLHARIAPDTDQSVVLDRINARLSRRFAVGHATVQVERDTCPDHPTS